MERSGVKFFICIAILVSFAASILSLGFSLDVQPASATVESTTVALPVIMYHSILDSVSKAGKYTITPAVLEQDFQYLKEQGYTAVLPDDLIAYANGERQLPPKPILITFDDGYYNNYSYAFPLLKKYDMKAVISIVGNFTEQYSEKEAIMNNNYSHLSWTQLKEMLSEGVIAIGNHSYDMHREQTRIGFCRVSNESEQEYIFNITQDVAHMQALCRNHLDGYEVKTLTYPYGTYNQITEEIAEELGFSITLTCYEKINVLTFGQKDTIYSLGRFNRPYGITTYEFMQKLES